MSEPKVRLSFEVPGATMLSSQECEKMSKKEAYNRTTIVIGHQVKKGKKLVTEKQTLHINTRKPKPAKQCIIIPKEAYNYMVSKEGIPTKGGDERKLVISPIVWSNMKPEKRLNVHMKLLVESLGGFNPEWEILDD